MSVDTVIVDEIHALVPGKRGAHLAISLERLETLRRGRPPLQRIGLSATQRPLEEVARFLGGNERARGRGGGGREREQGGRRAEGSHRRASRSSCTTSSAIPLTPAAPRAVTIINASEKKQLTLRVEVPVEDMARMDRRIVRFVQVPQRRGDPNGSTDPVPSGPRSIPACSS